MNKMIEYIGFKPLNSIGVSKTTLNSTQKGKVQESTGKQNIHLLNFNDYRKDLRISYNAKCVEEDFYNVLGVIGEPEKNCKCCFLSVKLKGKNADWLVANNACNAFEIKFKRYFWKNNWRKMNTFVAGIEYDKEVMLYHFHTLLILKDLKKEYSNHEITSILTFIIKGLDETNEKNANVVKIRIFPFCVETTDLGDTIEYLVKSSSKTHKPLTRKLYKRIKPEKNSYENTATINYLSAEKAITKRRVVKNEGGRELKSIFLYG